MFLLKYNKNKKVDIRLNYSELCGLVDGAFVLSYPYRLEGDFP